MTHEQAVIAGNTIKNRFLLNYISEKGTTGLSRSHLVWMIEQLPSLTNNKAMRWLGYIQGVLVALEIATLDDMKQISKEASHG